MLISVSLRGNHKTVVILAAVITVSGNSFVTLCRQVSYFVGRFGASFGISLRKDASGRKDVAMWRPVSVLSISEAPEKDEFERRAFRP